MKSCARAETIAYGPQDTHDEAWTPRVGSTAALQQGFHVVPANVTQGAVRPAADRINYAVVGFALTPLLASCGPEGPRR